MNDIQPIMKGRAPTLEAIGMTKTFGPLVALDDVSISVKAGSFHALQISVVVPSDSSSTMESAVPE